MLRGFMGFTYRAIVVFALIALLGGVALANAAANLTGTAGGQGAAATVHFFKTFATSYKDAAGSDPAGKP